MTDSNSCPLCPPRTPDAVNALLVRKLSVSTLYLDRNQTYRGHCQLVFDPRHVTGLEALSTGECTKMMSDLHAAARALSRACRPDRMNYASLGNLVPHLHWHLVPRYTSDPRWGLPIYTTAPSDMMVTPIASDDYAELIRLIDRELDALLAGTAE